MKLVALKHIFYLFLYFLTQSTPGQKHFNLTVKLPQGVNPDKIEAWLDNGKDVKQIKPQSAERGQLVFTGNYYSLYAAINLQNSADEQILALTPVFFMQEKPATIAFHKADSATHSLNNYALQNVLDFKEEKKQLDEYTVIEREKSLYYEKQYGERIFSGQDTAVRDPYFKILMPALRKKKLEYIVKHSGSYYAFYTFRTEVARAGILPADSLYLAFNSFPDRFKYSDEGNYLNAFLHARSSLPNGHAVDFVTKDIHKKTVRLSQFKGRKYVLLHFWATWCTPCMQELPALKKISNKYKSKDLQIISIALPSSSYAAYLATINQFQMNWIQVYNPRDLINKYGNEPTPRLCLIDKTAILMYDQIGLGKNDDVGLHELNEKLKEVMHE